MTKQRTLRSARFSIAKFVTLALSLAAVLVLDVQPAHGQWNLSYEIQDSFVYESGGCLDPDLRFPDSTSLWTVNNLSVQSRAVAGAYGWHYDGQEIDTAWNKIDTEVRFLQVGTNTFQLTRRWDQFHRMPWCDNGGLQYWVYDFKEVATFTGPTGSRSLWTLYQEGEGELPEVAATRLDYQLVEINPALAMSIARLEQALIEARANLIANASKLAARDAEIAEMLDMMEQLEADLNRLRNQSLDAITPDALRAILDQYPELPQDLRDSVVQLISDLQTREDELREQIENVLDLFGAEADAARDMVTRGATRAGWNGEDYGNYASGISNASIPSVATPDIGSSSTFDPNDDPYARFADQVIASLNATTSAGRVVKRAEFAAIVDSWRENHRALDAIILARNTVSPAERAALSNAQIRVLEVVRRYMDGNYWFNDVPVSPRVKQLVDGVISNRYAALAMAIKSGMNQWTGPVPGQRIILDMTEGAGAVLENGYEEETPDAQVTVDRIVGWITNAVTFGISFTPAGDILDACQAITGKENCLHTGRDLEPWERAASGLGVVVGSGKFWSAIATVASAAAIAPNIARYVRALPAGKVFKPFHEDYFRHNLGVLTGIVPPAGAQAHHMLPQHYRREFWDAGLVCDDPRYGVWWETVEHNAKAQEYDQLWDRFFLDNPEPSAEQILNFARKLADDYNLFINW